MENSIKDILARNSMHKIYGTKTLNPKIHFGLC